MRTLHRSNRQHSNVLGFRFMLKSAVHACVSCSHCQILQIEEFHYSSSLAPLLKQEHHCVSTLTIKLYTILHDSHMLAEGFSTKLQPLNHRLLMGFLIQASSDLSLLVAPL